VLQVNYFKHECGVVPPKSALTAGEISNDADFLTDLVVGADRTKRYSEYSDAYSKSTVRRDMMEIVARNAKVCFICPPCQLASCGDLLSFWDSVRRWSDHSGSPCWNKQCTSE
jgi:hypothetical protein